MVAACIQGRKFVFFLTQESMYLISALSYGGTFNLYLAKSKSGGSYTRLTEFAKTFPRLGQCVKVMSSLNRAILTVKLKECVHFQELCYMFHQLNDLDELSLPSQFSHRLASVDLLTQDKAEIKAIALCLLRIIFILSCESWSAVSLTSLYDTLYKLLKNGKISRELFEFLIQEALKKQIFVPKILQEAVKKSTSSGLQIALPSLG